MPALTSILPQNIKLLAISFLLIPLIPDSSQACEVPPPHLTVHFLNVGYVT